MNKRMLIQKIAYIGVILILLLAFFYSGLQILESTVFRHEETEVSLEKRKTLVVDGISYFPRQDITVILLMGIDQSGPVVASESYNNDRAADMITLVVCDEKKEEIRLLSLNRDTMLEMPVLGFDRRRAGTIVGQLALAHTYGSGLEDSCENIKTAISDFLKGLRIDYYIAMNMDAVAILNDSVGGVTVTVTDDFSAVDPSITLGEMTLQGEQALHFVRSRKDVGTHLNLSRMERQKEYMNSFTVAFREKVCGSDTFFLRTYNTVAPYLVSDLPINTLNAMMSRYEGYEVVEVLSLPGENKMGQTYYEFYPDQMELEALTLELFYGPK